MAVLDAKKLNDQLKKKAFSNLYYLYGSDTAQVENSIKLLLKEISADDPDSITKLDGGELDVSRLADEAELCPMFADYNCIWIHDLDLEKQREDVRKAVQGVLENVAPQTVLVFDVTGYDIYGGKTGKNKRPTPKNKKIIDYIAKNGTVCCFEPKTPVQAAAGIMAMAKHSGCTMGSPAAVLLAELCGAQTLRISQEMGKLCAYADGEEITEQMVREMVTPQIETTVYALTNAVMRHKAPDAMRALEELLGMRVEMPYLMASVSGAMIDVQRACAARQSGRNSENVAHDFSYGFSFIVDNAFRSSTGETQEHIDLCLLLLSRAEQKMHSEAVDERVLLEQTIVEMLRR